MNEAIIRDLVSAKTLIYMTSIEIHACVNVAVANNDIKLQLEVFMEFHTLDSRL